MSEMRREYVTMWPCENVPTFTGQHIQEFQVPLNLFENQNYETEQNYKLE